MGCAGWGVVSSLLTDSDTPFRNRPLISCIISLRMMMVWIWCLRRLGRMWYLIGLRLCLGEVMMMLFYKFVYLSFYYPMLNYEKGNITSSQT
ncbi:hypothetical protein BDQ17DRAFT_1109211 [Cyathus striatus]|nr:hypothetical protein BDQ17DRAFT_1109211 [Cyathus striatus]